VQNGYVWKMSKSKVFIGIAVSFAAGVWLGCRYNPPQFYVFVGLAIAAILFALAYNAKHKAAALLAVFLFAATCGVLRLQSSQRPNEYQNLFDSKQQLEGYIVEDTDIRISNQFLTIQPKNFSQRILATANLTDSYFYGDWVVVSGKLTQPQNFSDFDYQKYLERFGVYAVMSYPKILVLKSHRQNIIKEWLLDIKWAFTKRVERLLPEPQASLLMGILIGARKTLPQNIVDNFNATGTSHIIAISGYNITIIISSLAFLAGWLGRRKSFWLTLGLILGFVILSGASASVIRAAIMGSLGLLSANIGRQYAVGPALFFAGFIMLVINPKILYWDVSFQLSFLATLGIVYFQPLLNDLTAVWDDFTGIKSILLVTLSATFVTLPLILFTFGRLSVVSPLVNILILPIVPLTMLLGFLSVLPFVGAGCAFAANLLLIYILRTTAAFAAVPNGSLSVKISEYLFAVLALAVVGVYLLLKRMVAKKLHRADIIRNV
jgi:competence protein ComEC